MKPITYRSVVGSGVGIVELTGYPTNTPGLLVGEAYKPCRDGDREWVVIHARTGTVTPFCWDSPEGALAYADKLADLGDWRLDHATTAKFVEPAIRLLMDWAFDLGGRTHRTLSSRATSESVDNGVIA